MNAFTKSLRAPSKDARALRVRPLLRRACIALFASTLVACSDSQTGPRTTDPRAQYFTGLLNNVAWSGSPTAVIVPGSDNVDRLILVGSTNDLMFTIKITVNGVGNYDLANADVALVSLVGGDVQTGGYVGSATNPGTLNIAEYGRSGGMLRATLNFSVGHLEGESRFGATAEFRGGHVLARLQSVLSSP